jgi:hypothetical protein
MGRFIHLLQNGSRRDSHVAPVTLIEENAVTHKPDSYNQPGLRCAHCMPSTMPMNFPCQV